MRAHAHTPLGQGAADGACPAYVSGWEQAHPGSVHADPPDDFARREVPPRRAAPADPGATTSRWNSSARATTPPAGTSAGELRLVFEQREIVRDALGVEEVGEVGPGAGGEFGVEPVLRGDQ